MLVSKNSNLFWNMSGYHFHDLYEINLVITGNVSFFVSDKMYQAEAGSLLLLSPTDLHKSSSVPGQLYERFVMYFTPESIAGLSTNATNLMECFDNRPPDFSHCLQVAPSDLPRLIRLFERVTKYQDSSEYGADIQKTLVLAEILLRVNELCRSSSSHIPVPSGPAMSKVVPILAYIQEHLSGDLSLDTLARVSFMGKHHLTSVFKTATGFTPNEYIIHRRIMKARELLKKNEMSVQLVGETAGFRNNSHFIRTFTKLVGTSPKQYALRQQTGLSGQISRATQKAERA